MSDSMTNLEMQDVLSSIRRLVSQKKDVKKDGAMVQDDRFILTPAHRVEVPQVDAVPEFLPDLQRPPEPVVPLELSDLVVPQAAPEQAISNAADQPVTEEGIDTSDGDTSVVASDAMAPLGAAQRAATTLEMRIAELEVAVDRTGDEWEPDGSEPEAEQGPDRHIFEVVDNTHFVQPPESREPTREAPLQLADVAVFTHFPGKPAAPADMAATEEVAEEAGTVEEKISAVPESNPPEPEVERFPAQVVNNDDDVFVDEDILRRVVAEVVREELSGKLGERITRNVRRMVRREIENTLSLKEFD